MDFVKEHRMGDKVNFLGYQSGYSKNLSKYDCGLMCSVSEGFGRVTAEYMMAGLPVIASDTGANPELVKMHENGLLYRWDDIEDLKEKMVYISKNKKEARRMGMNGRKFAVENFTLEANADKMYELYQKTGLQG